MKARSVPTAVHDLPQEPFGLSLGGKRITRESALNECSRYPQKGNTKESRPPSIQRQLRPPHPGRPLPSATLLAWNLKATRHNTNILTQPPVSLPSACAGVLYSLHKHVTSPIRMSAALAAETTSELFASCCSPVQHNNPSQESTHSLDIC